MRKCWKNGDSVASILSTKLSIEVSTLMDAFWVKTVKITEKTKCWICGRNSKELKNVIEAYWQSGELGKDMGLDACFEIVSIKKMMSNERIQIPICAICSQLMLEYVIRYIKENLEVVVKVEQPKVSTQL
ncbi:MAG: hypothetical protein ACPLVJ_00130 [Candidatus Bathyarchaeales archaeon]